MRVIGYLNGESAARLFVDYLYVKGVESEAEWDSSERWAIWVHSEEQLDFAHRLLGEFNANPGDPRFATEGHKAAAMRQTTAKDDARYQKRVKGFAEMVSSLSQAQSGKLTLGLIITCVAIFVPMISSRALWEQIFFWLSISNFAPVGGSIGLPEVLQGQVWRLVTPILMHGGFIHIFFNLWWLKALGGILEWKMGWRPLLALIIVIAVGSNLAQYYAGGHRFLGISGVVFGLLGFIWMKGKHDPNFGLQLPQAIVFMMLLWLFLGYSGVLERSGMAIANTAHSAGLIIGMLCAFLPVWRSDR
ncbi:MAG: Rhomboid protease GlpG [Verrucomicrobia subdivision 3 bacterium]|nr:Rhomboid protease GlpG [Limisphaerales bacterium]MCS1413954.1 Rhomboid protease GlpG [Limisphaerales bacterium]